MPDLIGRIAEFYTQRPDTVSRTDRGTSEQECTEPSSPDRRRLLTAGGCTAATLLAGCSGALPGGAALSGGNETTSPDGTGTPTETAAPTETQPTATAGGTDSGTPAPETDVVGLVPQKDGSDYEFIVTLRSPGGADWWQVETLDGSKLGRKEFSSPRRGSQFTTSKTMGVGDATAVVVRGHDVKSGYGGQVMLADLENGVINVEKQGPERKSFEGYSF